MNPAKDRLRTWGYRMADKTIAQLRTLGDADLRARALRIALEDMRPGLNERVRQRTVVYRRLGQSYPQALREALAEVYMRLAAHRLNEAESLGDNGEPTTPPAQQPSREERIIGGVGTMISAAIRGALGIAGQVTEARQERRQFEFEREQWRREASAAEMRAEREYALAERRLASEARGREMEALEAERERELERRLDVLGPPPSEVGVGTVLVVGGLLVVVGVGGYLIYKSWKKKREERGEE